jgi:GNAT superfamily N-acetyltransferase
MCADTDAPNPLPPSGRGWREAPGEGFRRATPSDARAIAALLAASFAEYRPFYTPAGYAATTPPSEVIAERIDEGPVWVCDHFGLIGTLGSVRKGADLYLRGMAVHPLVRRGHIGRRLLEIAEEFARGERCEGLVLSTTPFLDRAIALYQRYGFVRTVDPPHDLFGTPLFTMRKRI